MYLKRIKILFFLFCLAFVGCSPSSNESPAVPTQTDPPTSNNSGHWTHVSPETGFIPSIKFHPTENCVVWASGDDMSGLYKSTDCGIHWASVSTPANMSSYYLNFNPSNANKIYAINFFGLGILKSTDGGTNWTLSQSGLPSTINNRRAFQVAIHPNSASIIIVATQAGLYRSLDDGANFTRLNTVWGSAFQAVVFSSTGRLFAGDITGVFKYSDDNGSTWTDILTASLPISEMHVSSNALYILYVDGTLQYLDLPNLATGGFLNIGSTGITTDALVTLTVVSGASQITDTLYLGTSKKASLPSNRWGLFKSTNGGSTWNQLTNNLTDISIFRVAVAPNDPNLLLVSSSSSGGVFRSINGGATFTHSSSGLHAVSALGFAQNPHNTNELILSSSVGYGMGQTYRSTNLGGAWNILPEINSADGTLSWNFDPDQNGVVLAGMIGTGVFRSTTGVTGTFSRVVSSNVKVPKIVRDLGNSNIVYALATEGAVGTPSTDIRVYYSNNGGSSFNIRSNLYAADLAAHPLNTNEAIAASVDNAYVSTDGFATQNSIQASAIATTEGGLSAIAFDPTVLNTVWIGGAKGGLYKTTNYQSTGGGVTWATVPSPVSNVLISKILIRDEDSVKTIYISSFGGDIYWNISGKLALFKSIDNGMSWTELSTELNPCTSFWNFTPVIGSTKDLWGQLWGGGLFRLTH